MKREPGALGKGEAQLLWRTTGLWTSEHGAMVDVRRHKPTLERAQKSCLGHRSYALGVRQAHVGVFDSVDHAPVSTQGATSKLAHIHYDYDGQARLDRPLDLSPYLLAFLTLVSRCGPVGLQACRPKRLGDLAGRGAEQSEQVIRRKALADPVDYLAVFPVVAPVFFVVDWLPQTVGIEPMIVKQGCHGRLAAPVPVHPRTRAVVRVQVVDAAPRLRLDDSPHVCFRHMH
jgi:hypothetical protein